MDLLALRFAAIAALMACLAFSQDDQLEGAPKLKRGAQTGKRETTTTSESSRPTVPRPATPAAERREEETVPDAPVASDPIGRAREAALEFLQGLPNFICRQDVQRQQSRQRPLEWKDMDRVTAELVFESGREDYRNIRVNGKPVASMDETGGAWSSGDFGSTLGIVFDERSQAAFQFVANERISGRTALRYSFTVAQKDSGWALKPANGAEVKAAFRGVVWIDEQTQRALRLELEARIPAGFGFSAAEAAIDYGFVDISGQQYLLPVHSEVLMCERAAARCSRNLVDYRDYRRFAGESTISFDEPPPQ